MKDNISCSSAKGFHMQLSRRITHAPQNGASTPISPRFITLGVDTSLPAIPDARQVGSFLTPDRASEASSALTIALDSIAAFSRVRGATDLYLQGGQTVTVDQPACEVLSALSTTASRRFILCGTLADQSAVWVDPEMVDGWTEKNSRASFHASAITHVSVFLRTGHTITLAGTTAAELMERLQAA